MGCRWGITVRVMGRGGQCPEEDAAVLSVEEAGGLAGMCGVHGPF